MKCGLAGYLPCYELVAFSKQPSRVRGPQPVQDFWNLRFWVRFQDFMIQNSFVPHGYVCPAIERAGYTCCSWALVTHACRLLGGFPTLAPPLQLQSGGHPDGFGIAGGEICHRFLLALFTGLAVRCDYFPGESCPYLAIFISPRCVDRLAPWARARLPGDQCCCAWTILPWPEWYT